MTIRVLVVDDEEGMIRSYERILKTLKYEVCGTAGTYEEAVEAALGTSPDIIIMDISLGRSKSDGIDAAREINSLLDVPVIFVSAYGKTSDTERLLEPWSYGFIKKPFDLVEIQNSIEIAVYKYRTSKYERELLRRDSILRAVNSAATLFLSKRPFEESLGKTIELLGRAIGSGHICLYRNFCSTGNIVGAKPEHEWFDEERPEGSGDVSGKIIYDSAPPGFMDALYAGGIVRLPGDAVKNENCSVFCPEGFHMVNIPVFCGAFWWGFLSIETDSKQGSCSEIETEALVTAASILGSALNQKRMNDVLLRREEEYRSLYNMMRRMCDNVPDAMWVKGTDRRYNFVNRKFADSFLFAEDTVEPLGKNVEYFGKRERSARPEDACWYDLDKKSVGIDSSVLNDGEPVNIEQELSMRGVSGYYDVFRTPFYDDEGNLIGIVGCARDETMRKATENNLRELNERFKTFMNALPGHAFIKSPDGIIEYVNENPSLRDRIYTSDWVGKRESEIFGELDSDFMQNSDRRVINEGCQNRIEEIISVDGQRHIYNILKFPIESAGEKEQIGGIVLDITDRVNAEEMLRRSEELSSLLVNQMPVIVWTTGNDLRVTYGAGDPLKDLGITPETVRGKYIYDILNDESGDPESSPFDPASCFFGALLGESSEFECRIREKDFYIYVQPFRNNRGDITGTAGLAYDITDKKLAEKALLESEERYRTLVENIKVKIIIAQDGRIVYGNPCILEFLSLSSEELLGKKFSTYIVPGDLGFVEDLHRRRLSGETGLPVNYKIQCYSGNMEPRLHDLTTTVITWDGRPATLNFLIDIEDETKVKEELEGSLHEKTLLLEEVHHRVKNNLALINSLLMMQIRNIDHPEVREGLLMARTRIFSIASVHEALYRSDSISSIPAKEHFGKIGAEILGNYDPDKRLNLVIEGDDAELDLNIATPISIVINELMINAIKYAYPDEQEGVISIKFVNRGDSLVIILMDEGIGIPDDFTLEDARSLGLSLVRNIIVSQLEGEISLEKGTGTRWVIEIPFSS